MAGAGPPSTATLHAAGKVVDADLRRHDDVRAGMTLYVSTMYASLSRRMMHLLARKP
jgi:hypothetical protein